MQDILGSLPAVLRELDPVGTAVEPVVFAAWKRCVDGALAENVVPLRMESSRLIAAVPNEIWRRNVADLGPAIAAKLNSALGSRVVSYIDFRVDEKAVRDNRKPDERDEVIGPDAGTAASIKESLGAAADSIADDDLREQFLSAAAGSLARSMKARQAE